MTVPIILSIIEYASFRRAGLFALNQLAVALKSQCPLYPRKRTCAVALEMSARCRSGHEGFRESYRAPSMPAQSNEYYRLRFSEGSRLARRAFTITPIKGNLEGEGSSSDETHAFIGRCDRFRAVRHPRVLRRRRTGGPLPKGPSARQTRGDRDHRPARNEHIDGCC